MKVLIAEDNPALAAVLEFNLAQAGADVTWVTDGPSAIEQLHRVRFDLVITDYQMPGATGVEVLEAARTSGPNTTTPAILLTARELELDVPSLRERLAVDVTLPKPFSPREVVEISKRLVSTRTAQPHV